MFYIWNGTEPWKEKVICVLPLHFIGNVEHGKQENLTSSKWRRLLAKKQKKKTKESWEEINTEKDPFFPLYIHREIAREDANGIVRRSEKKEKLLFSLLSTKERLGDV